MPAIDVYEQNQKSVNSISLSTVAREVYQVTQGQQDTLYTIATQCPLLGGEAVYEARFLYELMVAPLTVDDDSACTAVNLQFRTSELDDDEIGHITVSPNPASQALLITFEKPLEDGCHLSLMNQLGVSVFNSQIHGNLLSSFVPISNVTSGVYILRIHDTNGIEIHQSKLVVIK